MPDDLELDRLKLPPHSLEAEQSVLGGLLLDNEAADKVGDVITDADFYSDAHRLVYAHILRLVGDSKPADVVTVSESLASVQKLDYIGGLAYLGALVQNVPTAANIRHYAQIVRDRSILRQLAATAGDIADSAYNPLGRGAKEILDQAEARILHIANRASAARSNIRRSASSWPKWWSGSKRSTTATIRRRSPACRPGSPISTRRHPACSQAISSSSRAARRWARRRWRSTSRSTLRSTPRCRSPSSRWKWAPRSSRCA